MAEKFTAFVDPNLNATERRKLGLMMVEYVQRRSKKGLRAGGSKLLGPDLDNKYSKDYINSAEFKIAGKTGSRVNLTLTGDMLGSIEVLDISLPGRIVYGFKQGPNSDKAKWMREKNYEFLKMSSKEIKDLEGNFKKTGTSIIDPSIASDLIRRIFGN